MCIKRVWIDVDVYHEDCSKVLFVLLVYYVNLHYTCPCPPTTLFLLSCQRSKRQHLICLTKEYNCFLLTSSQKNQWLQRGNESHFTCSITSDYLKDYLMTTKKKGFGMQHLLPGNCNRAMNAITGGPH